MKFVSSTRAFERGFISGKVMLLCIFAAIVFMVKMHSDSSSFMGDSSASLQAELGEPIKKERIPRPT